MPKLAAQAEDFHHEYLCKQSQIDVFFPNKADRACSQNSFSTNN